MCWNVSWAFEKSPKMPICGGKRKENKQTKNPTDTHIVSYLWATQGKQDIKIKIRFPDSEQHLGKGFVCASVCFPGERG